ncbi:hypothetical protein CYQ88_10895 [Hydrogenovibrio sp. SC-1]|nr:hypothetical protein CYQ88_10895 [Hydrogenovibrio sp. SC-1]
MSPVGIQKTNDEVSQANMTGVSFNSIDETLNNISSTLKDLVQLKLSRRRVDGKIIGTGKADFTQGNACYTLSVEEGKRFYMVDVPGIEGDESQFENMVKEAVAQAHLIFYVNGTNKKPEKKTAAKIKSYLGRGSKVYAICNVRGMPDAYEFEEDRLSIMESHGGSEAAFQQTLDVLSSEIGEDSLIGGQCAQGLLAFCGLAFAKDQTTIHASRDNDLVRTQKNYLRWFENAEKMVDFSNVSGLAQVIKDKQDTYQEDIVEANKDKVKELLRQNEAELTKALREYQVFVNNLKAEFEICKKAITRALDNFETSVGSALKSHYHNFFTTLIEKSDEVVKNNFGDNDRIESEVNNASEKLNEELDGQLHSDIETLLGQLQEEISRAIIRLFENMKRVEYQANLDLDLEFDGKGLSTGLDIKDWGKIGFNIASYAASGAVIGFPFGGPVGAAIGGAIGAAIGVLISVLDLFVSEDKKIRKVQKRFGDKINKLRKKVFKNHEQQVQDIVSPLREGVNKQVIGEIDKLENAFKEAEALMQGQLDLMSELASKIEKMPYGEIQKV